jgi:hypothetical protein
LLAIVVLLLLIPATLVVYAVERLGGNLVRV